jgi:hypothetical protein
MVSANRSWTCWIDRFEQRLLERGRRVQEPACVIFQEAQRPAIARDWPHQGIVDPDHGLFQRGARHAQRERLPEARPVECGRLAAAQQDRFVIPEALRAAAGFDDRGAAPIDREDDVVVSVVEISAVPRNPHRRGRAFQQLQARQRQGSIAGLENLARRRLDVDAQHHVAIMLTPICKPILLGEFVSRKFENTRA